MKKTVKVNIGGFSYNIDEDAYNILNSYIEELKIKLGGGNEAAEILSDIEERISELIATKLGKQESVSKQAVEEVISQLGRPEEISGSYTNTQKVREGKVPKRLYRNPDGSIIAGVCSGLGEYFAVDPIVIRLIFIILLLLKGVGLLLYLVLWIATPRAVTPKQKLEMKGNPVTLSNIEKNITEEINMVAGNIRKSNPKNFIEKFLNFIGQIAYWILKALLVIVKVFAIVIGVILIVTMLFAFLTIVGVIFFSSQVFSWFNPEIGNFSIGEFITSMFDISSSIWVTIPIFLILAIPILALVYAGFRILFRFKARDGVIGITAAVVWVAAIVALAFTVFFQARSLTINSTVKNSVELSAAGSKSKTIYLKLFNHNEGSTREDGFGYVFFDYSLLNVNGEKIIAGKPDLVIDKSSNDLPVLEIVKKARGGSQANASENASVIIYNYTVQDSLLVLNSRFTIPQDVKWKSQDVALRLMLPEGYSVHLDSSSVELLSYNQPFSNFWPDEMVGKTWTMTRNGLREAR